MARTSARLSGGSKSLSAHKRTVSATTPVSEPKRSRTAKAAPTKSPYFDPSDGEDDDSVEGVSPDDSEVSDFEEASARSGESSGPGEDDEDYDHEEQPQKRKADSSQKRAPGSATTTKGSNDLLRADVKTGLGPGTQVIIKKPKARPAGKTPYEAHTIHPNTLLFLKDLKANNDRQWLKSNDAEFRQAERDWHSFVETLTEKLTEIDDTIPELPVKDLIFRIYRDVRFSPDPTPYKPHFSAAWSRTGRKGPYAAYYVQIAPDDQSFVGGGLWHPDAAPTAAMRNNIDQRPSQILDVLLDDGMRRAFLKDASKKKDAVVKAFVATNAENALKTKPKGYDGDHENIQLLRLRNFTVGRKILDEEVLGEKGEDRISDLFRCMKPFITYLNSIVMPDEQHSDEDLEDASEEGSDDASTGDED